MHTVATVADSSGLNDSNCYDGTHRMTETNDSLTCGLVCTSAMDPYKKDMKRPWNIGPVVEVYSPD